MNKKSIDDKTNKGSKKSLMPLFKFLGKFILVIVVYYTFIAVANESLFDFYLNITAEISSIILNIFGQETSISGNMISSPTTVIMLSFGCEGTEPIIIFLAGMIAVPIAFKKKWLLIILGVLSLYTLNFIRIVGLFFIQMNFPESFSSFHDVYFPLIFILFALISLALCIKWADGK